MIQTVHVRSASNRKNYITMLLQRSAKGARPLKSAVIKELKMKTPVKDFVLPIIEEMIREGEELKKTKFLVQRRGDFVDLQGFGKFIGRLSSLAFILGELGQPWKDELTKEHGKNAHPTTVRLIGILEAIK